MKSEKGTFGKLQQNTKYSNGFSSDLSYVSGIKSNIVLKHKVDMHNSSHSNKKKAQFLLTDRKVQEFEVEGGYFRNSITLSSVF